MDLPRTPSPFPSAEPLVPTIDRITKECPRFRILIVGRAGVGKSSLINAIFKTSLADVKDNQAGTADINYEIISEHNKLFALHDSEGYEPGEREKLGTLEKFIKKRKKAVADRIHAIWLCIPVPFVDGRIFEDGDEKVFQLERNNAPIIVVFTKYDLLVASANRGRGVRPEILYQNRCVDPLKELTKNITEEIPYVSVSKEDPNSLQQLVEITMRNVHVESSILAPQSIFSMFRGRKVQYSEVKEDLSDSAKVTFAAAQRINMEPKIRASINVGKKRYWKGIASGLDFLHLKLKNCLFVLHKDIVGIWNIRGLDQYLSGQDFVKHITEIVSDLSDQPSSAAGAVGGAIGTASAAAGLTHGILGGAVAAGPAIGIVAPVVVAVLLAAWAYEVYKKTPGNIRCLMAYVVDLTLIMQAVFQVSLKNKNGEVAQERVEEIIEKYKQSEMKRSVHATIKEFVDNGFPAFGRGSALSAMESLIMKHKDFTP